MASLPTTFDAASVEPSAPRELLPPGNYMVQIVRSDMKPTKNGTGQYLELEMAVLDGVHAHARIYDRLNLVNANAQAAEIANRTLSSICHATGKMTVSDSEQLHHISMIATVAVEPAKGEYGPSNRVKGYAAASGSKPVTFTPHAATTATTSASKPAASAQPPWRRSA